MTDLQGAQVQTNQNGKQFLYIPIEDADLFLSDKGKVYINLAMWAKRNGVDQYGKTHGIKLSPSQAYRQRIGDEAVKNLPFIGSAKEIVPKNQGGYQQPQNQPVYQQTAPRGYQQPQYPQNPAPQSNPFASTDDNMLF
ncbi:hypothetical protein [Clavibacter sp.]|uniref:hypothetical protein n=1 Tax=Clavibacter sp. TaxID=1871044 RepID=UPI0019C7FD0F|nr:hypothetical protein [Clavibacter sp.]MBD5381999.1 hypothetical protein [Clavibacter sp.]